MIWSRRSVVELPVAGKTDPLVRKHRPDYQIALFMGLLMMLGLIIMYAIGPQRAQVMNSAYGSDYSETYFFMKQAISLGLALVAFVAMAYFPYQKVVKYGKQLLIVGLAACVLLAIASATGWGIAQESLGATRWFNLGAFGSMQPSEFLKFGLLVFAAGFLGVRMKQGSVNNVSATLVPLGIVTAISAFFVIVVQKDLGTGMALVAILATMLFVAGLNLRLGAMIAAGVLVLGMLLIFTSPHRVERVATFIQGDKTTTSDEQGYHITHAKIAIGSGGFFGVGIGNSVQATGYLPEAINDSVFAIMGETFGFVGLMVILGLFFALLLRLLKVMDHLVDPRLRLLVAGVFGWLAAHVVLNVAAMIGIFPLTGITLPLLSFGGTSMVFIAAALGLAFQLSRYTVHGSRLKEGVTDENSGSRRRIRGSRYPGSRGIT